MIKAAAGRALEQGLTPDCKPTSYFSDHQYPDDYPSTFKGDATASPPPSEVREKQSYPSSRNSKRRFVDSSVSGTSSPPAAGRQLNVTDWNDRRRSDFSGPNFYAPSSSQGHAADPPRPPKEGMEWVWFPEGYWAEREHFESPRRKGELPRKWFNRSPSIGRRRSSSSVAQKLAQFTSSLEISRLVDTQRSETSISAMSKGSDAESRLEKLRMGFSYMSPTYPHFISPSGEPEGLYCKTKRNLGGRVVTRPNTVCPILTPFT